MIVVVQRLNHAGLHQVQKQFLYLMKTCVAWPGCLSATAGCLSAATGCCCLCPLTLGCFLFRDLCCLLHPLCSLPCWWIGHSLMMQNWVCLLTYVISNHIVHIDQTFKCGSSMQVVSDLFPAEVSLGPFCRGWGWVQDNWLSTRYM